MAQESGTQANSGGRPTPKSSKGTLAFLVLAIVFGAFMIATGPALTSQTQSHVFETDTSPTNLVLPPGGEKFWFGEGNDGGGVRHIAYFAVTSPSQDSVEFRVTVGGSVNGTIFSTQSSYVEADFTIPAGTEFVNYTLFNPTGRTLTVIAAEVLFFEVDYPNQWVGNSIFYLGIAIVLAGLVGIGLSIMHRRAGIHPTF